MKKYLENIKIIIIRYEPFVIHFFSQNYQNSCMVLVTFASRVEKQHDQYYINILSLDRYEVADGLISKDLYQDVAWFEKKMLYKQRYNRVPESLYLHQSLYKMFSTPHNAQ